MRRAPTLLLGLLLMSGVCAAPRPLQASQQASDSLSFAGGTRFQFLLPVRGMGPVQAQVSWSPAVEAQAYLFTPSQKTPVTSSRGRGALTLVHPILAPTGGEWMLEIVVQTDDPNVSGTVRLTWPGAAGSQLVWRNAGPTDPHIQERLAQLSTSLANVLQGRTPRNDAERGLQARLTEQPELRAELQRIQTVASVRLPVLRQVAPARVRNDFTFQQVQPVERVQVRPLQPVRPAQPLQPAPPPAGEPALPQRPTLEPGLALSARFMLLNCFSEMTWDRGSDSDEPYALIGFIRQSGGEAVGGRTRVFSDVDDGEQRPTGVANQELARFYLDSRSFFVMAMMENDEGNPSLVLNRFLRSLELGIDMVGEGWGWWEFLPVAGWIWSALGNRDDLIGNARSMTITPDGWYNEQGNLMTWNTSTEYGLGPIVTWDFRGDGGHYGIMLRLEPIRVHS
ncbi:MAG TPA: hypothetical protein VLC48_10210, partial [Gemmatimonadota bacterium]|nr:hypothetical protein [Gemmatimonadota bacterium]